MYVWLTARNLRTTLAASIVAASLLLSAGCSFETSASGLECSHEGASRDGEICRDGFWRLVDDAGLDAQPSNNSHLEDADLDAPDQTDVDPNDTDIVPDVSVDTDVEQDAPSCTQTNGGVETCDGLDNDCDGQIDGPGADDAQTFYKDADGDGFGDPTDQVTACSAPAGYIADGGDCDDTDTATNPDAAEVCDGIADNNCDQSVDESCPCTNGETRECGTDEGICQPGTQTCKNGQWESECRGESPAQTEVCDGVDNDCDGQIDNGFADKGASCSVGQGACAATGVYVCTQDGSGTECGATAGSPQTETCDDVDNDCDGRIDNGFPDKGASCTVGQGACEATGVYVCSQNGSGVECDATPGTPAASDACGDGIDNNCDGQIDEGCHCDYNGDSEGVCAFGTLGPNGQCQRPANYEVQEGSCDGLDNDCDGDVDEWLRDYLYVDADGDGYGEGGRYDGTRVCPTTPGYVQQFGDCDDGDPWTNPGADEICDGKDNNCNGINNDTNSGEANSWCNQKSSVNTYCGGPSAGTTHFCCEFSQDGNLGCDFETICYGGTDEDGDGAIDCADSDCNGLSCGDGKTCQSQTCQPI